VSRVQLAINVDDLPAAVAFYTKLFDTPPAKLRPGYANFSIADPPLKLVLIAGEQRGGTLYHLGVEVATTPEVVSAAHRLRANGLEATDEREVDCCYARQDKVWVRDPSGAPWEIYTVLGDAPAATVAKAGDCCEASSTTKASASPIGASSDRLCCAS
jgi:catechol 2,3-dioxygenase-like lactoylglutathione lyase family enzyme